jgi:hypothetical protein
VSGVGFQFPPEKPPVTQAAEVTTLADPPIDAAVEEVEFTCRPQLELKPPEPVPENAPEAMASSTITQLPPYSVAMLVPVMSTDALLRIVPKNVATGLPYAAERWVVTLTALILEELTVKMFVVGFHVPSSMSAAFDGEPKLEGEFCDTMLSAVLETVLVFGRNRTAPSAAASAIFCSFNLQ